MATTIMFEPITHFRCSFPLEQIESDYKLYQVKLRQALTENQYQQEQIGKYTKQRQLKLQFNEKRIAKDYMNNIREKIKTQSQNDAPHKRSNSLVTVAKRRTKNAVMFTITAEPKPKPILKTKQSSSPANLQRVTSAPSDGQRYKKTSMKIPAIEIDDSDDDLSTSNAYSYTQVCSSSEQSISNNHQTARQSILNTLMLHFNSSPPLDMSKWNLLRDFDEKFSTSISSKVYRNFERIIL